MKKIILPFLMIFSSITFSQEVKIEKNNIIKIDNADFLKYEKINIISHSFKDLKDNEIIFFKINNNETPDYMNDDFFTLNFINEKVKIESTDFTRIAALFNSKKTCEKLIQWLVKDKVINSDGTINSEKLDIFYQKFHEDIQNRTSR